MGVQQGPRKVSPPHLYGPGPPAGALYDRPHTLRDYGQVRGEGPPRAWDWDP